MPVAALKAAEAFAAGDVTVFVFAGPVDAALSAVPFGGEITAAAALDKAFWGSQQIIASGAAAGGRVIAVHAGLLNKDTDDVRRVADAVVKGIKRAIAAGATEPLLVLHDSIQMGGATAYENATLVALIAAAGAVYTPLSIRLDRGEAAAEPVRTIHVKSAHPRLAQLLAQAAAIEEGKRVARDVGGGDPELMAPIGCADYLRKAFEGLPISVSVVEDTEALRVEYPLAHAVARASLHVPRHAPRIVRMQYEAPAADGSIGQQIYLVGKGITYDTGGADVKTGGHMIGMSRDKCGAAAAAGIMRSLAALAPTGVRVVAYLGFVRNSIGSDSYVADEIIRAHSGCRVLVRNTDAEGRMVLSDMLSHARAEIVATPRERRPASTVVHTIATLTGHAVLAHGMGYSIVMDNGPARAAGLSEGLRRVGEAMGDPFEVSHVRREDYDFVAPKTAEYDVIQVNNLPSAATPRGHQFPAAVMAIASGLDKHGGDSADPIAYAHCDMGGASVAAPFLDGVVTGNPVAAFVARYFLNM